jgi:hypothetical protein
VCAVVLRLKVDQWTKMKVQCVFAQRRKEAPTTRPDGLYPVDCGPFVETEVWRMVIAGCGTSRDE